MYIAILGRQPELAIAELETVFGSDNVTVSSSQSAIIKSDTFEIDKMGGVQKAGKIIHHLRQTDIIYLTRLIVDVYSKKWSEFDGKITLGISIYDNEVSPRQVQKIGIIIKQKIKKHGVHLRLIPNKSVALSTATCHHNKLGLSSNKVELIIVRAVNSYIIAESTGSQNITAYAKRDQARPSRDAFVGMLPPKLAQIMINLAHIKSPATILDPFCGTGVILQESLLMGYNAYGTDLSDKMVSYSQNNLEWLSEKYNKSFSFSVSHGDAMNAKWSKPIDAVVCESYLGQPFSAPPSQEKLKEVTSNCNYIISGFLKNISSQIQSGTPLCIAIPAWRNRDGKFTYLSINPEKFGYKQVEFKNISNKNLVYYRDAQVVARQLLVLKKI